MRICLPGTRQRSLFIVHQFNDLTNKNAKLTDESNMPVTRKTPERSKAKRYTSVVFFLSLGLFLLWFISRGLDFQLIAAEFRNVNYFWIALAVLASILSHMVRALRWNILIESMGYDTSASQTFHAVMTGYLSNLAVPRLGEITRCVMLGKMTNKPFNTLMGTVVSERVFDMFTLAFLVLLTISFQFSFLKNYLNWLLFDPVLQKGEENWFMLLVLGILALGVITWLLFFLRKRLLDPVTDSFFHKLKRQLSGLKSGLLTIMTMKRKALFLLYSFIIWLLYFFTVYFCFFAIEATSHLTVSAGITLLAVGSLGIVAPVPGGIGTYHFLTMTTLGELYGIAAEPAISYAYISHAIQTIVVLLTGTMSWAMVSLVLKRNSHIANE